MGISQAWHGGSNSRTSREVKMHSVQQETWQGLRKTSLLSTEVSLVRTQVIWLFYYEVNVYRERLTDEKTCSRDRSPYPGPTPLQLCSFINFF